MREFSTKFSLTDKSLQTGKPCYLRSLFAFTPNRSTRSSSLVTLNRPSNCSRLKNTNRSFYHSAPALWNTLPPDLLLFHGFLIILLRLNLFRIHLFLPFALSSSLCFESSRLIFSFFISSIVCTHLGFLRTDISGIDLARLLHVILIS